MRLFLGAPGFHNLLGQLVESPHLTVHSVRHPPMAWYAVPKILDLEAALEATREEAAKRRDDRCKQRHHQRVQLQKVMSREF